MDAKTRRIARVRRHSRVRKKVAGTAERPRLAVYRSNRHIYVQLIDDRAASTLAAASDAEIEAVEGQDRPRAKRSASSSPTARRAPGSTGSCSTGVGGGTTAASPRSPKVLEREDSRSDVTTL